MTESSKNPTELQKKVTLAIEFLKKKGISAAYAICPEAQKVLEENELQVVPCKNYTTMKNNTAFTASTFPEKATHTIDGETIIGRTTRVLHEGISVCMFVTTELIKKKELPTCLSLLDQHVTKGSGSSASRAKNTQNKTAPAETATA